MNQSSTSSQYEEGYSVIPLDQSASDASTIRAESTSSVVDNNCTIIDLSYKLTTADDLTETEQETQLLSQVCY